MSAVCCNAESGLNHIQFGTFWSHSLGWETPNVLGQLSTSDSHIQMDDRDMSDIMDAAGNSASVIWDMVLNHYHGKAGIRTHGILARRMELLTANWRAATLGII